MNEAQSPSSASTTPATNIPVANEVYISNPLLAFKDAFIRLRQTNLVSVVVAMAIGAVVTIGLLMTFVGVLLVNAFRAYSGELPSTTDNLTSFGGVLLALLAAGLVSYIFALAVEYLLVRSQNLDKVTLANSLSRAIRRLPVAIVTGFLSGIMILAGLILFIIPGIYLIIRLAHIQSLIVNENHGPIGTIKRSFELTKGRIGNVIGAAMVIGAIAITLNIILELATYAAIQSFDWILSIIIILLTTLVAALVSAVAQVGLSHRYHQADLVSRGAIVDQPTSPVNYLMVIALIVLVAISTLISSQANQSSVPGFNFDFNSNTRQPNEA